MTEEMTINLINRAHPSKGLTQIRFPLRAIKWLLDKPSRTNATMTQWCNSRLKHGLPAFPASGWSRYD